MKVQYEFNFLWLDLFLVQITNKEEHIKCCGDMLWDFGLIIKNVNQHILQAFKFFSAQPIALV